MRILGNILWLLCGGLLNTLGYVLAGCVFCITLIGIPIGLQCFKLAGLMFWPFGAEVQYGGGLGSLFLNIIWIVLFGLPMALHSLLWGCILCVTVVGIPFGLQHFKMAKLSLMPFGTTVV